MLALVVLALVVLALVVSCPCVAGAAAAGVMDGVASAVLVFVAAELVLSWSCVG
jgi:hypothetical protein